MQPPLRACPTCGTDIANIDLGMRDYSRWLNPIMPGKVGGTDVDLVLHQQATDRMLMVEFKDHGKQLGLGQRLVFKALKRKGIDVWVVWQIDDTHVLAGELDKTGEVRFAENMTANQLGLKARAWWIDGLRELPHA